MKMRECDDSLKAFVLIDSLPDMLLPALAYAASQKNVHSNRRSADLRQILRACLSCPHVGRGEGTHTLYAFLTTEPNGVVGPIHPKAMPVILREDDWDKWLNAPADEAMKLQRPWPDDGLKIGKRGPDKEDAGS